MTLQWKTKAQIDADNAAEAAKKTLGIPQEALDKLMEPEAKAAAKPKKPAAKAKTPAPTQSVEVQAQLAPPKFKPKAAGKAVVTEEMKMVDELVTLSNWMTEHEVEAKVKRITDLKKSLQSIAAEMPPTVEAVLHGIIGEVTFSAAKVMTKVNATSEELKKMLGEEVYNSIATVSVGDATKYLSAIELEKITTKEYGSRTLKTCKTK